jgi:hypothetical protein
MSTQPEDQFTLLYEDGKRKVLHEFQCIGTDEIVDEFINFMRGVGHLEINIIERMHEISKQYLELYHSNKEMFLVLQQEELNVIE